MKGSSVSQAFIAGQKKLFGESKAMAESSQFLPQAYGLEQKKGKGKSTTLGIRNTKVTSNLCIKRLISLMLKSLNQKYLLKFLGLPYFFLLQAGPRNAMSGYGKVILNTVMYI